MQLETVLPSQPDIVLLDNMTPAELRKAVQMRTHLAPEVQLEASGGVHLKNLREIAETGVDRIESSENPDLLGNLNAEIGAIIDQQPGPHVVAGIDTRPAIGLEQSFLQFWSLFFKSCPGACIDAVGDIDGPKRKVPAIAFILE